MVQEYCYSEYGGPEVQEFRDDEMPTPLAGELLIEVRAAVEIGHAKGKVVLRIGSD